MKAIDPLSRSRTRHRKGYQPRKTRHAAHIHFYESIRLLAML
jgi:hypothetical protein